MKKLVCVFLLGSLLSFGAHRGKPKPKLAPEISAADPQANVRVVVQWKFIPGPAHHAKVIARGGSISRTYRNIKAGVYTLSASAAVALAKDPDVAYVAVDRPVKPLLDYTAAAINASAAWSQGYDGAGIGVAVIDSGMAQSPDLTNGNLTVYNQDFTGEIAANANLKDTANAPDLFGHGQHVAGIIASSGKSSSCGACTRLLKGIAPGVSLINLRVLDENGTGTDSEVIAAIDQAIALKNTYNIRVINLSLGRPVYESYAVDPLCQAVEQAWQAGIVVVVAAGNDGRDNSVGNHGYGTITAPGNDPYVITVGAMKTMQTMTPTDDAIASYSSKGPTAIDYIAKPDIVAPGNLVVSLLASNQETLVTQYPSNLVPESYYTSSTDTSPSSSYFTLSGTSMAAPVVSGAVADLLEAQPSLTPDQVKARLMLTANKNFPVSTTATDPATGQTYLSFYDPFTVGAGYLDLAAALSSTAVAQGSAMSPAVGYDSSSSTVYFVGNPATSWLPADVQSPFSFSSVWGTIGAAAGDWGQRLSSTAGDWGQRVDATAGDWGQRMRAANGDWGQIVSATAGDWGQISAASSPTSAQASPVSIRGEQ